MCEPWPGPRCNDKTKDRDVKLAQFKETIKTHKPGTLNYLNSLTHLIAAQHIYDTTPQGVKELQEEFNKTHKKLNPALMSRIVRAKLTRTFQTEALNEIKNGRLGNIATIIESYEELFNKQEIETIIACAREAIEEAHVTTAIKKTNNTDISMNEEILNKIVTAPTRSMVEEYETFLQNINEALQKKYGNQPPEEIRKAYDALTKTEPPTMVGMKTYETLGNALTHSKKQLTLEIGAVAAIQDVSKETAAEYYEAYKAQYEQNYSHLPLEKQPLPPRSWIEGELYDNGISKHSRSSFVPRNPASLYALYRLRVDLNAVPDYLKKSSRIISITPKGEGYIAKHSTRGGKQLGQEVFSSLESLPTYIKNTETNSVILMIEEPSGPLTKYVKEGRIISIYDFVSKHFDLPEKTNKIFAEYFKTNEDPSAMYNALRKKILKTWASKPLRNNIAKISFTPTGDSAYAALVR